MKINSFSLERQRQYSSMLTNQVKFVSKESSWYKDPDNYNICTHCKEYETIKTPLRLIPFCERCYKLQFLKHDGTYITGNKYGIAKDFEDIRKGMVKVPQLEQPSVKVIED